MLVDGIRKAGDPQRRPAPVRSRRHALRGHGRRRRHQPAAQGRLASTARSSPSTSRPTRRPCSPRAIATRQGLCFADDGRFLSDRARPRSRRRGQRHRAGQGLRLARLAGTGIKNYTPTIAPAGCVVYEDDAIPQWKGSLLFTTLKGNDLRRLTFAADGSVADEEVLYDGESAGCGTSPSAPTAPSTSPRPTRTPAATRSRATTASSRLSPKP